MGLSGAVLPDCRDNPALTAGYCRDNPALGTLIAAMLRHQGLGAIAEHPEIDAAFSALILSRPLRFCEVRS